MSIINFTLELAKMDPATRHEIYKKSIGVIFEFEDDNPELGVAHAFINKGSYEILFSFEKELIEGSEPTEHAPGEDSYYEITAKVDSVKLHKEDDSTDDKPVDRMTELVINNSLRDHLEQIINW